MVDQATLVQGMTDNASLLAPDGINELTPEQRIEVTKYLVEKITTSDDILGAVTRKVKQIRRRAEKK